MGIVKEVEIEGKRAEALFDTGSFIHMSQGHFWRVSLSERSEEAAFSRLFCYSIVARRGLSSTASWPNKVKKANSSETCPSLGVITAGGLVNWIVCFFARIKYIRSHICLLEDSATRGAIVRLCGHLASWGFSLTKLCLAIISPRIAHLPSLSYNVYW